MNMDQALREFGVQDDTLSSDEKNFLDVNGYLPLGSDSHTKTDCEP